MRILVSGSTKTVAALAPRWPGHLGILLTPGNWNTVDSVVATGLPWGIDNGAYSGFDADAFRCLVARAAGQPRLLWVVCPDVVGDARGTAALHARWEPELRCAGVPVAFVLQDGQESLPLPGAEAYFLGGTTRWKLSQSAGDVAAEGKRRGALLHVGRVNSLRRLEFALSMAADSVDGSGYSRFAAVARAKGRTDMLLERHLAYIVELERREREHAALF